MVFSEKYVKNGGFPMFFRGTFNKVSLMESVDKASRIVDRKSIEPLSGFIFFLVENEKVFAASSDGRNSSRIRVKPESIEGSAGFGVPFKKLTGLLRSIPKKDITLIYDEDTSWVVMKGEGFEAEIPAISGKSFPISTFDVEGNGVSIPVDSVVKALDKVRYASSDSMGMGPEGIKLSLDSGKLSAMALNGFCLAYYEVDAGEGKFDFVISKPFSRSIVRVLPKGGVVSVYQEGSEVFFCTEDMVVTSVTYPDNFPDSKDIKDKTAESVLEVSLEDLKSCLSMSSAINENMAGVRVKLRPSSDEIEFSVDREEGKASFSIPGKYVGSEMELVINEKDLIDLLNNLEEPSVRIEFFGADKPFIIREQTESYLYINLMAPLTLAEGG